jgi:transcriptional regulator with XRE-family HTH domain
MSTPYHQFGVIVRQRRMELQTSQEVLAHKAGLNRSFVGEVERGATVPSLDTMVKLAAALDIKLSALLARCEQGVLS